MRAAAAVVVNHPIGPGHHGGALVGVKRGPQFTHSPDRVAQFVVRLAGGLERVIDPVPRGNARIVPDAPPLLDAPKAVGNPPQFRIERRRIAAFALA